MKYFILTWYFEIAFFVSFFLFLLLKSFISLPFEGPDEQAHFATVSYLSETGNMPPNKGNLSLELAQSEKFLGTLRDGRGNNQYTYHPDFRIPYSDSINGPNEDAMIRLNSFDIRTTYVATEAAIYPPLYYRYSSFFYNLASSGSIISRIFSVRVGSVFLGTILALVAYLLGKQLFNKRSFGFLLALLTIFQPMASFVLASVNSDVLHILWASLFILFAVKYLENGQRRDVGLMGVSIGMDLLTKPQASFFVIAGILAIGFRLENFKNLKKLALDSAVFFVPVVILAIFQGSPSLAELNPKSNDGQKSLFEFAKYSAGVFVRQNIVWFWGVYKWLGVVNPKIVWFLGNRLVIASGIGLSFVIVREIISRRSMFEKWKSIRVWVFLAVVTGGYVAAIFFYDWKFFEANGYSFGVQGRYYLPMILSILSILVAGLSLPFKSEKVKKVVLIILCLTFAIFQIVSTVHFLSIYYDLAPFSRLINQISQYKPEIIKGQIWNLLFGCYIVSICVCVIITIYSSLNEKTNIERH